MFWGVFGPLDKIKLYCTFFIFQLNIVTIKKGKNKQTKKHNVFSTVLECIQLDTFQRTDVENRQQF